MARTPGTLDRLLGTRAHHRAPRVTGAVRVVAGALFVVFGLPKYTDHARWVSDLVTYGLPESSLLVYGIGTAEILGGLALIAAVALRPVAALLAAIMVGAVVTGGLVGGNPASLTLAPALLVAALVVLWSTWPAARPVAAPADARTEGGPQGA